MVKEFGRLTEFGWIIKQSLGSSHFGSLLFSDIVRETQFQIKDHGRQSRRAFSTPKVEARQELGRHLWGKTEREVMKEDLVMKRGESGAEGQDLEIGEENRGQSEEKGLEIANQEESESEEAGEDEEEGSKDVEGDKEAGEKEGEKTRNTPENRRTSQNKIKEFFSNLSIFSKNTVKTGKQDEARKIENDENKEQDTVDKEKGEDGLGKATEIKTEDGGDKPKEEGKEEPEGQAETGEETESTEGDSREMRATEGLGDEASSNPFLQKDGEETEIKADTETEYEESETEIIGRPTEVSLDKLRVDFQDSESVSQMPQKGQNRDDDHEENRPETSLKEVLKNEKKNNKEMPVETSQNKKKSKQKKTKKNMLKKSSLEMLISTNNNRNKRRKSSVFLMNEKQSAKLTDIMR